MKPIRTLLCLAAALSLGACKTTDIASGASIALGLVPLVSGSIGNKPAAATPATGMSKDSFEDTKALYLSTTKRGAAAFRSGTIPVSTDADVQRDNFCDLVLADPNGSGLAVVTDHGGELSALECRAKDEVDELINAFERQDAVAFASHKGKATGHIRAMDAIISQAEKEAQ